MTNKIKLLKETMKDILWNENDEIVLDKITEASRWNVHHELIFKYDGKLWRTLYSIGATEYQNEGPWEYEEEVECVEVIETQIMSTTYINA